MEYISIFVDVMVNVENYIIGFIIVQLLAMDSMDSEHLLFLSEGQSRCSTFNKEEVC